MRWSGSRAGRSRCLRKARWNSCARPVRPDPGRSPGIDPAVRAPDGGSIIAIGAYAEMLRANASGQLTEGRFRRARYRARASHERREVPGGGADGVSHMSSAEARALRLFDRYAEMGAREREAGLEALKREDPALHDALSALLAADSCARPLDRAPVATVAAIMQARSSAVQDERIGRQVGPWRIVGVIGEGGMGTVYRVERADDQYEQTAALKYVRADVSTERLVAAFREERNVLASLSHPDIVPLLDGGVDDSGQPWFVMQHVEGEPIDRWCDQRRSSVRERVELFVQACDPIVHAHARGILHQDIKPSNLLITPDGRIQLLDFGLSMPVAGGRDGRRLAATSGYTAPEVLTGAVPGLAADVYSLGILLCRLLCGNLPVDPASPLHRLQAPGDLVARMTPSMLAARGASNGPSLRRIVRGELDSIVLRCVAEDPCDRYSGVDQLRADLRNWLSGRPVSACGTGLAYRARCFVRRNAYLSAMLAVVVAALATLGGAWLWQRAQAEREQVAASHVDRLLESSIGTATLSGMGDMPLTSAALLQRSEDYLRDPTLEEAADVRSRGLSILGRSWAALGDYGRAEGLAHEAGELSSGNALLSAFNMATLAQIQNQRARHADAQTSAREGLAMLPLRLSDQYRLARVRLMGQLAIAQSGQGQSQDAIRTLSSAIAEAERLPAMSGDAVVAQLLIQRGNWYRWRRKMADSEADLVRALALVEETDPVIADDVRESLVRTVRASRQPGREQRSLQLADALLRSRQRTLGERHPQTGVAWSELAFIRLLNRDAKGAQEAVDAARSILVESLGEEHPLVARTHLAQGHIDSLAGQVEAGITHVERGLGIYLANNGAVHEHALEARLLLGNMHWSMHSLTGDKGELQQALDYVKAAIDDSMSAHGSVDAIHRIAYADLLSGSGRQEEAGRQLQQALAGAIEQYGEGSQEALHARSSRLKLLVNGDGDGETIEREYRDLFSGLEAVDTLYARAIAHSAWLDKAVWLRRQRRVDEARTALLHARDEAVRAGQERWIQVSDLRLKELEEEAGANAR